MTRSSDEPHKATTILIVEDSPTQLEALRFLLEEEGFSVVAATNGSEGLCAAQAQRVDLVVSDIVMPGMDGYELCKRLRACESLRALPVILLTSLGDPSDVIKGLECGANNFICKPYDDRVLLARVHNVLANQEIRKAAPSEMGISIFFAGQRFFITADRLQILDLLLSTYESAVNRNSELAHARDQLRILNEQLEVRVAERTAALEMEMVERMKAQEREQHLNRVLRAIRNVNQLIVREKDPKRLIEQACSMLVETRGYRAAWIAVEAQKGAPVIVAEAGWAEHFDQFSVSVREGSPPPCWARARAASGLAIIDSRQDCRHCPLWRAYRQDLAAVVPLRHNGTEYGVLGVCFAPNVGIDDDEASLLLEVAGDLGLALHGVATDKARKESEARLRAVANSTTDAFVLQDASGIIAYWNPAAQRIFGYSENEALGRNAHDLLMPDRFRAQYETGIKEFERTGEGPIVGKVTEYLARHKDGHECPVEIAVSSIPGKEGYGASAVIRDISERKRAEQERKRLEEQLLISQKMEAIGSLAGGVAHDFNNLLSVILNYCDFAMSALKRDDPVKADLLEIKKAGERAAALTRQLLAFSRKQVSQPVALNLNGVVVEIESMLRRIVGEDIEIAKVLAPDLGLTLADPGQLEQVLMNLVVNARDAMPAGGKLTIETSNVEIDHEYVACHLSTKPGAYVLIAITDTGCGMDESTKARLFEPFFTTKEKGKGTGLGLSTVYGIVKQNGGNIWVYSERGRGTTFKIYLPRDLSTTPWGPTKAPAAITLRTGTETVLVVEDEEALRRVARRTLSAAGYVVLTAAHGDDALLIGSSHKGEIHLLLTDVVMPRMSGRTLADLLTVTRPSLKVLYMSGYTDNAIVHHGVLDRGTLFLGKPFTAEELTRKVREVLDGQAS